MRIPEPARLLSAAALCLCSAAAGQSKVIPVTYHDFNASHADFEDPTCRGGTGMVQDTLDALHKPVHLPGNVCADNRLPDWFRDVADNKRYCRDLTLAQKPGTENTFEYDDPDFFPIDDVPSNENRFKASDGKIHNFHFCMEMHATFKYRGGEVFDFRGDDDVWVFVNNHLALDLGGLHGALPGTVDLDRQKDSLKIAAGNYYNFDFFFCERQTVESHMKVTTSIDILPPPTPGLHIADANLNVLPPGDTLQMAQGDAARVFAAVKVGVKSQTVDCADVVSQTKDPAAGDWTFNGAALPAGGQASVSPAGLASGTYKLVLEKDGLRDSVYVRIADLPLAATPTADPPGREFAGKLQVALADQTPGAIIHYTVDGTVPTAASPVYAGPIALTAGTVIQAIAEKPGYRTSAVMRETYVRQLAKALRGWYLDKDGDGRIETAVIVFDSAFAGRPSSVAFTDPFDRGKPLLPSGSTAGPAARSVTYTLPPFAPGTGFEPATLASISADADYGAQGVVMADSVGPVVREVKSFPTADASRPAAVEVGFSEPVPLDVASLIFPPEIKRGQGLVAEADVKVASIEALSPTRYRFTFAPDSKYPVPGDSARLAPSRPVSDAAGNRSDMRYYVPVTGTAARAAGDLRAGLVEGVTQGPQRIAERAVPNPVVVHGDRTCVNCGDAVIRSVLPNTDPGAISGVGPTWKVKSKFPFSYSLAFYDNLGQFVNKAEGDVGPQAFETLRATEAAGDSVIVQLTFLPIAGDGHALGTGAYIMRGTLRIHDQAGIKGSQGEAINVVPVERRLVTRFGYVRKR